MAAHWLVRYADDRLTHQPSECDMRDNIEMMLRFKRVDRPAAGVYGGWCVAPFHYKHFDKLLADLSVTSSTAIRWRRCMPPDADADARFLASAPNYQAAA
jgi:hypothetical protein